MLRLVLALMVAGGVMCFIGYQEYSVGEGTSQEPTDVALADLEQGTSAPNNHLRVGEHLAIYEELIYCYTDDLVLSQEPTDTTRVDYAYYPIVSLVHPFVQGVFELDRLTPEEAEAKAQDLWLDDFKVLVRTNRFSTVGELPETYGRERAVEGLIVNRISSLGWEERSLLAESFPDLDLDSILILQEGRKPASEVFSFGMIAAGVALFLGGAGMGVISLGR
jgi:hypothetical protein